MAVRYPKIYVSVKLERQVRRAAPLAARCAINS